MDSCEEIGFEVRQRELQRVEDNEHYEDILFYIKEWTEKCKDRVACKSRDYSTPCCILSKMIKVFSKT